MYDVKEVVESLAYNRIKFLKTRKGLQYLIDKYPKDWSLSKCLEHERNFVYDSIGWSVQAYIISKLARLAEEEF